MGVVDTVLGLGGMVLWLGSLAVAGTGYWWFYRYRTAVATAAGAGAGLLAGMAVGLGLPVIVGGVGGAVLGLFAAKSHPRGGSLTLGIATGIAFGPLVAIAATGTASPVGSFAAGAALATVLAGLAWRFPRTLVVAGTAAMAGATRVALSAGVTPSIETLLTGSVTGARVFTGQGGAFLFILPVITLTLGTTLQPFLVEYSETVPPMFPASVRGLLSFDEQYGETTDAASAACPNCGALGDPGHARCHACEEGDDPNEYGVPDDAVAVDVPCPHCGERPIAESATARTVTGFLIAYRIRTEQHVGCHRCVRGNLWSAAGKTALTGWWSISCILMNPVIILWNVGRGLVNRGPTLPLAAALNESGIEFEYLDDESRFDADAFHEDEVVVRGLVHLGCAVMLADGRATTAESKSIRDAVTELSDGYRPDEVESLIQDTARDGPVLEDVLGGLGEILTAEGREVALGLATAVATAEGAVGSRQQSMLADVADAFDVEDAAAD